MEHYNNSVYKKIKNKEIDEILGDIIEEDINNIMNKEQKIELIVNKNDKIKTQNLKLYINGFSYNLKNQKKYDKMSYLKLGLLSCIFKIIGGGIFIIILIFIIISIL